jgi:hypothetical protein
MISHPQTQAQLHRTWMGLIRRTLEIKSEADLVGPGAPPGTVPTDLEQATGLERLEILGKMQGVDVFDMKPLDSSRKGTDGVSISLEEGDVTRKKRIRSLILVFYRYLGQPNYRQIVR